MWYGSYVQTYLERDVRQLLDVRDLTLFQRFLRLLAGRTGQLLNQSALADETGVSHNTIREWTSVLEASYIIHRLPPHHRNFKKRLVKTPKVYFLDAGLAAWLLGIKTAQQLATHPLRGALFEAWVVSEYLKARWNRGLPSNLSFWRDRSGREVDLVIDNGVKLWPVEIKSGATVSRDAFRGLERWCFAGSSVGVNLPAPTLPSRHSSTAGQRHGCSGTSKSCPGAIWQQMRRMRVHVEAVTRLPTQAGSDACARRDACCTGRHGPLK